MECIHMNKSENNETNNYLNLITLMESKGLKVRSQLEYDPRSGWTGIRLFLYDDNLGYLNTTGEYSFRPTHGTVIDLSLNGYCFRESSFDTSNNQIHDF